MFSWESKDATFQMQYTTSVKKYILTVYLAAT